MEQNRTEEQKSLAEYIKAKAEREAKEQAEQTAFINSLK